MKKIALLILSLFGAFFLFISFQNFTSVNLGEVKTDVTIDTMDSDNAVSIDRHLRKKKRAANPR